MPAVPADADALAFSPIGHSSPDRIHHAGHFMTRNAWIGNSWPKTLDDDRIAVTNTAGMNLDAHLAWAWIGDL
jgi:hypothetical protein